MEFGDHIGIIGAVHRDWSRLHTALAALGRHDVRVVVQLGDFGLRADELTEERVPVMLRRSLESLDQKLLFMDGVEDAVRLRFRRAELERPCWPLERPRWFTPRLGYLSRGFRDRLSPEVTLAAFAGPRDGAPAFRIEDADLVALGPNHASVLLTYAAPVPLRVPRLTSSAEPAAQPEWPAPGDFPSVYDALLAVRPWLAVSTGESLVVRTLADMSPRGRFITQFALIPPVTSDGIAGIILNTRTLELQVIDVDGGTVELPVEVTNLATQTSGRWLLTTEKSQHLIDLDRMFWERIPGPDALPYDAPYTGHIRAFDDLAVGRHGYIITEPDRPLVEYNWARTSLIRAIEPLEPEDPPPAAAG